MRVVHTADEHNVGLENTAELIQAVHTSWWNTLQLTFTSSHNAAKYIAHFTNAHASSPTNHSDYSMHADAYTCITCFNPSLLCLLLAVGSLLLLLKMPNIDLVLGLSFLVIRLGCVIQLS